MDMYVIPDDLASFIDQRWKSGGFGVEESMLEMQSKKLICTPDPSASDDTRRAAMSRCLIYRR